MNLSIGNVYSFATYAPAMFSESFNRCRILAIMDYNTAKKYANIDLLQRSIYPELPDGTPDRTASYSYVLFKNLDSGIQSVMAYPWIIESSITEILTSNLNITVYNASDLEATRIRDVLNSMGYQFLINVVPTDE